VGSRTDTPWPDGELGTNVPVIVGRHRLAADVVGELVSNLAVVDVRIVVCDLNEMAVSPRTMSEVFAPVSDYLALWPGTLVVVCVADPARHALLLPAAIAGRLLVHRFIEAGVREARQLTVPLEYAETPLAPVPTSAAGARDFVRCTLQDWQLVDLAGLASLVTSELVTNALQHSATVLDLSLGHANTRLRVAVHDHGGGAPTLRAATSADATAQLSGRGLPIIEALSRGWGVFATRPRGKTVWALLDAG
jgi:hypothetical protein